MTTCGRRRNWPLIKTEALPFDNSVKSNILGKYVMRKSERAYERTMGCLRRGVCVRERERESETKQERIKRQRQYTRERDVRETFLYCESRC